MKPTAPPPFAYVFAGRLLTSWKQLARAAILNGPRPYT